MIEGCTDINNLPGLLAHCVSVNEIEVVGVMLSKRQVNNVTIWLKRRCHYGRYVCVDWQWQCITSTSTQSKRTAKPCQMGTTIKCDRLWSQLFLLPLLLLYSDVVSDLLLFNELFKYLLSENGGSGSQKSSFSAGFCKTIYTYILTLTHT